MHALRHAVLLVALVSSLGAEAQTWRSGGPHGGHANALVRAESEPRIWYVAAPDGVFRSEDGGETWSKVSALTEVYNLTVDPSNARRVYALRAAPLGSPRVYRSDSGGESWTPLTNGLPAGRSFTIDPNTLLVDPRDPRQLLLASACWHDDCRGGGLFHSADGGETWTRTGGLLWPSALARDPLLPDTLYASDFVRGAVRSDDGGRTWQSQAPFVPSREVVADPFDASQRYGIGKLPYLMVSGEAGRTWSGGEVRVATGETIPRWHDAELEIDSKTGRLFIGTGSTASGGIYRSGDRGATWAPLEAEGREPITALVFDEATGSLTTVTQTGVYRSDGFPWNTWRELPVGHSARAMRDVAVHPRQPATVFAIHWNRVFRSDDFGATWRQAGEPLPLVGHQAPQGFDIAVDSGGDVYVRGLTHLGERVFKLPDGAREWLDLGRQSGSFITADPNARGTVYVGSSVTRDGGASWQYVNALQHFHDLAVDPTDSRRLFASVSGVMQSTDGGATWTRRFDAIVSSDFAISAADPRIVTFLGRIDHSTRVVVRSTDGGTTWNAVKPVTTDGSAFDFWHGDTLVADPRDARTLYATAAGGVFRSLDGGATWRSIGRNLPSTGSIAIDSEGRFLHAATAQGVWELSLQGGPRRSVRQ